MKLPLIPQRIFEGHLLGVADNDKTYFYNWNDLTRPLHILNMGAEKIWWDESGEQMAIANETKFLLHTFNKSNLSLSEVLVVEDKVTSGVFVNKIFYYINKAGKLHISFLGKSFFLANAEKKQFILGALEQQNRLYLFDRNNSVYSHHIPFELLNHIYSFILGMAKSEPEIPEVFRDRVAKFYHAFEFRKEAYKLTENQDHKF